MFNQIGSKRLERARRILIEELLRVGRLIDPANNSHTDGIGNSEKESFQDLPVLQVIVEQPHENLDMFPKASETNRLNEDVEHPIQLETNTQDSLYDSNIDESSVPLDNPVIHTEQLYRDQSAAEELARELIDIIENLINQRTGEQLDDVMRDDMIRVVIEHIDSWLTYD